MKINDAKLTRYTLNNLCQFVTLKVKFIYDYLKINLFRDKLIFVVSCLGYFNYYEARTDTNSYFPID